MIEATKNKHKSIETDGVAKMQRGLAMGHFQGSDDAAAAQCPATDRAIDFSKRTLHGAFHPSEDAIAVAATSALYIFKA